MSEHYICMHRERETEMIFEQIEEFVFELIRVCVCERDCVRRCVFVPVWCNVML